MKNNKSINVRVNEELYNAIAADANTQQLSLNEIVRRVNLGLLFDFRPCRKSKFRSTSNLDWTAVRAI